MIKFFNNIAKILIIFFGIIFALMVGMIKFRNLFGTPIRNLKFKIKELCKKM
jgi:hypothetical protein